MRMTLFKALAYYLPIESEMYRRDARRFGVRATLASMYCAKSPHSMGVELARPVVPPGTSGNAEPLWLRKTMLAGAA